MLGDDDAFGYYVDPARFALPAPAVVPPAAVPPAAVPPAPGGFGALVVPQQYADSTYIASLSPRPLPHRRHVSAGSTPAGVVAQDASPDGLDSLPASVQTYVVKLPTRPSSTGSSPVYIGEPPRPVDDGFTLMPAPRGPSYAAVVVPRPISVVPADDAAAARVVESGRPTRPNGVLDSTDALEVAAMPDDPALKTLEWLTEPMEDIQKEFVAAADFCGDKLLEVIRRCSLIGFLQIFTARVFWLWMGTTLACECEMTRGQQSFLCPIFLAFALVASYILLPPSWKQRLSLETRLPA